MFTRAYGIPVYPTRRTADWALRLATIIAVLALLASVASLASCQATPARQAYITVDGATAAVGAVSDAYQVKAITKAQLATLAPYADAVLAAEKNLDAAISAGDVDLSTYLSALTDSVTSLVNSLAKAKTANVTTLPATAP